MKKRNIIVILLFLLVKIGFSQKHVVVDSATKEPIPFVSIKFLKNHKGFYSNEFGGFSLDEEITDTLQISCLGYKTILIPTASLKDTIYIAPEVVKLNEVVLNKTKHKKEVVGLKRKKINFYLNPSFQIGSLIEPSKDIVGKYIDNIIVPINKKSLPKKKADKKFKSVFKINVYAIEENLPSYPLLEKPIDVYVTNDSKDSVLVDLSNNFIEFAEEGLFISIEIIGEINEEGEVINSKNPRPSFVFSNKSIKEFSSKSYYKVKFYDEWKPMSIEKFHLKDEIFLAIGITLSSYE